MQTAVYVHIPWCVRKCPYCDFNSHALQGELDAPAYTAALMADLDQQAAAVSEPPASVFFGGGTPSLYPADGIAAILDGIARRTGLAGDAEVTLEANPGTLEAGRFAAYRKVGVNRLSIGVQSLQDTQLAALGRIHSAAQAREAVAAARDAGFRNFNLDLMYGLPGQTVEEALDDLDALIALAPPHLSWYQLTLEPNTLFHHAPPPLPDEDSLADMMDRGFARLGEAGYIQYEVSAWARPGHACRHNTNYWRFGDYLGLGAGAHGKLTGPCGVMRRVRPRGPADYLADPLGGRTWFVEPGTLPIEFMLNALRLNAGVESALFEAGTGLPLEVIAEPWSRARARGLMEDRDDRLCATGLGRRFLNDTLAVFEPG